MNAETSSLAFEDKDKSPNSIIAINVVSPSSTSKTTQSNVKTTSQRKKTLSNNMISSDPDKHTNLGEFTLKEIFKIIKRKGYNECLG